MRKKGINGEQKNMFVGVRLATKSVSPLVESVLPLAEKQQRKQEKIRTGPVLPRFGPVVAHLSK
jgi:hypothetical protein